ncbi:MAG: glycosyltransferase family 4 protein [Proteobacteria bacterium]|nr:glycosyltransferase family 4 protein [Pseudomonadota bacterium]
MKILHVIYDDLQNPWCGGGGALRAARINQRLAAEHEITVITGNFPGAENETINNIRYVRIGSSCSYLLSRMSFSFLCPIVLRKYSPDIVVQDASFFSPSYANLFVRAPHVTIVHHLMDSHALRLVFPFGFIPYLFEKSILKTSRNILTPSLALRGKITERYSEKTVMNIPNGVDDIYFNLVPEEENYMLFLGRIDMYMKGLDILLQAFSEINDRHVRLKIAGSGKARDKKKLKSLITDLKLDDRIDLLGRVGEDRKLELLRKAMFLVMPSRFEGWGITAVEANAAGKAVIGTLIDGLSEAVVDAETAMLVEPGNAEELKRAIEELLADKQRRIQLGEKGREHARQFIWDEIAAQQMAYYEAIRL